MSKLYIIPTPIGNLEDITLRAIRILKEVDLILAEDTRNSAKLLRHYQITSHMQSFHQYNEHKTLHAIVDKILSGEKIALISDAGTPGISDPGFILVRECIKNGLEVECLPGATAFVPALINSGLPSDKFLFEGFLPHKKGRTTRLEILAQSPYTLILYESPFRLVKTLEQLSKYFGEDRQASVSRELSKIFEETKRGTLKELMVYFSLKKVQGEIVIVIGGKP
jgi:16S rRNA (cytidine1402-2'-O)-methyltransferase